MKKTTAGTVLVVFIVAALFLGFLLVNKGDGPVMGMALADTSIDDPEAYAAAAETHNGVYLVVSNAFNGYQEDYRTGIPESSDLYAAVYFVECPQGAQFTGKWIVDGKLVMEEIGTLPTGPQGVISYLLESDLVVQGSYTFELYDGSEQIFETNFSVE